MENFKFIAATFTPFNSEGELNLDVIKSYAEHLIKVGAWGVFVCGTTGEGLSLTTEERMRVLEKWLDISNGKLKVFAHLGENSLVDAQVLAKHAQNVGADAIAAFAPSFFKPSTAKELVAFLSKIASSAPKLPFYYYHMPSCTGVNINVSEIIEEADRCIPNFAGVKYTHFDFYDMQNSIAFKEAKYEIFHGYDEVLICGLALGLKAGVGSTYNYALPIYKNVVNAFSAGNMEDARKWQMESVKIVNVLVKYGGGVRAGKAILKLIGIDCGDCRLPISPFSESELDLLKKDLEKIGFM